MRQMNLGKVAYHLFQAVRSQGVVANPVSDFGISERHPYTRQRTTFQTCLFSLQVLRAFEEQMMILVLNRASLK